jgi:hypothetical protein
MAIQAFLTSRLRPRRICVIAVAALSCAASAAAQISIGAARNFVVCPELMQTQDAPCWVAEYKGERYYLTVQTGRGGGVETFAPDLGHKALVEGVISDEPRICGGIVLRETRISVLYDNLDKECNKILPAGGYHTTSFRVIGLDGDPPAPRISTAVNGRYGGRPGLAARRALYAQNATARKEMTFSVPYFFDSTYIESLGPQETVEDAIDYAKAMGASKVRVISYRGETILSDGVPVIEKSGLAEKRATKLGDILVNFGWPADKLEVKWIDTPQSNGGSLDYKARRTDIIVTP